LTRHAALGAHVVAPGFPAAASALASQFSSMAPSPGTSAAGVPAQLPVLAGGAPAATVDPPPLGPSGPEAGPSGAPVGSHRSLILPRRPANEGRGTEAPGKQRGCR
jgi:hypothetical protein